MWQLDHHHTSTATTLHWMQCNWEVHRKWAYKICLLYLCILFVISNPQVALRLNLQATPHRHGDSREGGNPLTSTTPPSTIHIHHVRCTASLHPHTTTNHNVATHMVAEILAEQEGGHARCAVVCALPFFLKKKVIYWLHYLQLNLQWHGMNPNQNTRMWHRNNGDWRASIQGMPTIFHLYFFLLITCNLLAGHPPAKCTKRGIPPSCCVFFHTDMTRRGLPPLRCAFFHRHDEKRESLSHCVTFYMDVMRWENPFPLFSIW
jgi:hypothetical protein